MFVSIMDMNTAEEFNPLFTRELPVWKRAMDIFCTLLGMILLSPLFLGIFLFVKIVSPGPAFFKQERVGYGGKLFTFWKFRTMKVDADTSLHKEYLCELISGSLNGDDDDRPMTKLESDSQIIPFGRILRSSCLDELPQLINVLKGEMSLVGPRPPIPYEVEQYPRWYNGRFHSLPGMTGLWQVSGKNRLTFTEMIRLDIRYSKNMSFWLDFKIIMLTPWAIMVQIADSLKSRYNEAGPRLEKMKDD